jgi:hypothetical protein
MIRKDVKDILRLEDIANGDADDDDGPWDTRRIEEKV